MMKYFPYAFLFFCLVTGACKSKKEESNKNQKQPPPVVDVLIATYQPISNTIEVNGTVVPDEFVELHPEISGVLTYLNVSEGSFVKRGTIIARVNNSDLTSQLGKLKVQLSLARTTEQRYKKLLDINGINRADYDVALNQVNSLQADINVQQVMINKSIVKAPFGGVVGLRQISSGAYVNNSTILATIQKIDRLKIDFTLPQEYAGKIIKGSYVTIKTEGPDQGQQKAMIVATEPQANAATRNILVRAVLENGKANPGSFVKVLIDAGENKNSVMVPTSAIIPEDISKSLVTVKNGKAVYVKVQTGVRRAANIEVTNGVVAGDTIVVTGVLFTRPNAPVKVRSIKKLEEFN